MKARVMVLDDDEAARRGLVELLGGFGYEAFALDTGERAIDAAVKGEFDIALVDLKMPGMDGIEVLKRLRSVSPRSSVIMITAFATVETAVEAMKLGAFDYITKPFKAELLDGVIRSSLEAAEFERSLQRYERGLTGQSAFQMFREELATRRGIAISRESPRDLRRAHGLSGAELHWLTIDEAGEGRADPRDLDGIAGMVRSFMDDNRKSVVLMDGMELLVEHNGWEAVNGFIRNVIRDVSGRDAVLLVSARPGSLGQSVQQEMETLASGGYIQEMSESLANPIRREVVQYLSDAKIASFTDILMNTTETESPKLSFHIKKLVSFGVIAKDEDGKYRLTPRGESLFRVLKGIDGEGRKESKTYLVFEREGR